MNYDDDTLMAYADGELDPAQRAAIAEAIRTDPTLAAAVARHQALRQDVFAAFAGTLDEPVPQRLQAPAPARVHDFAAAQASRAASRQQAAPVPRATSWTRWGGLAAALIVGVLAGSLGSGGLKERPGLPLAQGPGGELSATGRLAQALDRQLAREPGDTGVQVGLSFASSRGSYCRTFRMGASAGLACREGGAWRIPVLAADAPQAGEYRQAAAAMPAAVLDAVDTLIVGATLDADAERAVRERGWERAPATPQ
ncbi:anti-sigma factor [Massilia sp. 9I]|uniref:anti-sigma factor family protein n=1 Tax=Massilia sp. 9I TaxID=2653152 RepID=UPI0012F38F56|nr:hypothetical protein [Massilia sp. 9I]VXB77295.1 Putative transmembrane transcriptional regulator (Anti-sigma factor) [Massilia sp. 9I]